MSAAPKEYEHISFKFNKSSFLLDGSTFDVTAYLLVPEDVMPELHQWEEMEAKDVDDRLRNHLAPSQMFNLLKDKGALLHRTDGPAYEEVQKDIRGKSTTVKSEYWEKGVAQNPTQGGGVIKSHGKYTL